MKYIDYKVEAWNRLQIPDDVSNEEIIEKLNEGKLPVDIGLDAGYEIEPMLDTEELMKIEHNEGEATIELIERGEDTEYGIIWSNKESGKTDTINDIQDLIKKYESYLTMSDNLNAKSSPIFADGISEVHLIEALKLDTVQIFVYGGYKFESIIHKYEVTYDELELETLWEIQDLIERAIDAEFI